MSFIRTPQRKVTLTEMPEEWDMPDNGLFDTDDDVFVDEGEVEEKMTQEIFNAFEEMIQDWKIKLEFIVTDGLKKIKKVTKQKKVMMKYLPGDGIPKSSQFLRQAKAEILSDWNKEMKTAMIATHTNLNKLGSEKVRECATKSKVIVLQNKNVTETVDIKKNVPNKQKQGSFQNLKFAIEQLQLYLKNTATTESQTMYLPIYRPHMSNMALAPAKLTKWNKWYSMLNMMMDINELPMNNTYIIPKSEEDIMEILKNFTIDQTSLNKNLEQWYKINETTAKKSIKLKVELKQPRRGELKQPRRGSNTLCRMKQRKERKECAKQFRLCEFKNKAGNHYFVVRRKEKPSGIPIEVEDIFAEWKPNFGDEGDSVKKIKRVRKLSHRQQRKEIIKEAEKENYIKEHIGPLTYCDALKKNMKLKDQQPFLEEILESWAQYMKELNQIVESPYEKVEEVEDIFKSWKHNFVERKVKLVRRLEAPEDIFLMWQHNLNEPKDYYKTFVKNNVQRKEPEKIHQSLKIYQNNRKQNPSYQRLEAPEEIFQMWQHNLKEPKDFYKRLVKNNIQMKEPEKIHQSLKIYQNNRKQNPTCQKLEAPEEIFQMWQHNLKEPKDYYKILVKNNVQKKEYGEVGQSLKIYQKKRKHSPAENPFHDWASKLILENTEESGRGESILTKIGPEEFFIDWLQQGCLQEPKVQRPAKVSNKTEESEQTPIIKRRLSQKQTNIDREEVEQTPTIKRRLSQKQKTKQFCSEDENEFVEDKESRRDDFKNNQKIKDKKRNEASRRSIKHAVGQLNMHL